MMAVGAISAGAAYAAYPPVAAQNLARASSGQNTAVDAKALPASAVAGQVDGQAGAQAQPIPGQQSAGQAASKPAKQAGELTPEELAQLAKLQARDREVRQHEAAHLAASGGLATSGARFSYQKGPDGVNYAVGGEVGINTSPGRTPEETIARARTIQAAALAPAEPSGADRAVAAAAQQMEVQARAELAQQSSVVGQAGANTETRVPSQSGAPNPPSDAPPNTPPAESAPALPRRAAQAAQAYAVAGQPSAAGLSVFA